MPFSLWSAWPVARPAWVSARPRLRVAGLLCFGIPSLLWLLLDARPVPAGVLPTLLLALGGGLLSSVGVLLLPRMAADARAPVPPPSAVQVGRVLGALPGALGALALWALLNLVAWVLQGMAIQVLAMPASRAATAVGLLGPTGVRVGVTLATLLLLAPLVTLVVRHAPALLYLTAPGATLRPSLERARARTRGRVVPILLAGVGPVLLGLWLVRSALGLLPELLDAEAALTARLWLEAAFRLWAAVELLPALAALLSLVELAPARTATATGRHG